MLKATIDNRTRLVQQPHHAQVSGYLAAHWGGANGFVRPGHYAGLASPERIRDEVVLGIAEHDNGWWEWEAIPRISRRDGLPIGLGEADSGEIRSELSEWRSGGFDRWRVGVARLAGTHPYAALLVSLHAYWLYAVEFQDLVDATDDVPRHFLFSGRNEAPVLVHDVEQTRSFLGEMAVVQEELKERIGADAAIADAQAPEYLGPHLRLLQLMDTLSLLLSLGDTGDHELEALPRESSADTVTITWHKKEERLFVLDPYPFDLDPLPVSIPARTVDTRSDAIRARRSSPYTALLAAPLQTEKFWLSSGH